MAAQYVNSETPTHCIIDFVMHARRSKKKKKLALILGGGGMSTSYIVGALAALKKEYKIKPDIIIAASGSAGTASYFVSGQFTTGVKKIWLKEILSPKFISGKGFFKEVHIDYLVDEVFKKKAKLKIEKVYDAKTLLAIPMINAKTGALKYFTNQDAADWFEVLRAAKAIPIFYDNAVRIGRGSYHDSHLSAVPETHVKKAREFGATHIISIHSVSEVVRKESSIFEYIWFKLHKSNRFRKQYKKIRNIHEGATENNITIFPSQTPFANLLDTKRSDIVDTIDLGYSDIKKHKTLQAFIKEYKSK